MNEKRIDICRIREFMIDVLNKYNTLRGKSLKNHETRFWDAVVFSASDLNQRIAFEKQIQEKQKKKELPLDVPFHIFSDKPGFKNGCGGSTMYVLEKLHEIYGSSLFKMRLLFIPAGGFSQRLPSLSVLGKLFCPLPFGNTFYQMIDLILATYLPFLENMSSGIFLASSDAIISYYLSQTDEWTFKNEGFTALAHPSSLDIGVGHGVYVLPNNQDIQKGTFMSNCIKVLQKPTKEEMYENEAVVNFPLEGHDAAETVFSDSAFFFDQNIVLKLIDFYKKSQPLNCELSSYGDFLQPLGSNAEFPTKTSINNNDNLLVARSSLYTTLHGSKLNILVLNESQFHHLGTIPEYIDSFCFKNEFSQAFPLRRFSYSAFSVQELGHDKLFGTVMHSVIHPMTSLPSSSVLEYCDFSVPVDIGDNCLISNCKYGYLLENGTSVVKVPEYTLLHTVCLKNSYVTIACGVFDDVKKSYLKEEALCVRFCGTELNCLFINGIDDIFNKDLERVSLWNARIFTSCSSMEESFKTTLKLVAAATSGSRDFHNLSSTELEENVSCISMEDILSLKDVEGMLHFQIELYQNILKFRGK